MVGDIPVMPQNLISIFPKKKLSQLHLGLEFVVLDLLYSIFQDFLLKKDNNLIGSLRRKSLHFRISFHQTSCLWIVRMFV